MCNFFCPFADNYLEKKGGELFIQANKLQTLVDKQGQDGPKYTVKIDDDFQYGQNEERTERFLVFHDKNNRPYQVRSFTMIRQTALRLELAPLRRATRHVTWKPSHWVGSQHGLR